MWKIPITMVGTSPMNRAENIHPPMRMGTVPANSRRAVAGTRTRGASDARPPGSGVTVSPAKSATSAPKTMMTASVTNTTVLADPLNWIAVPARRAPRPRPPAGAAPPMMAATRFARSGANSNRDAENALVAAPVASPWTTRAAMIHPMFGANRNMIIDASSTTSEPTRTGRRPTKSDSEPAMMRAMIRAIA